MSLRKHGVYAEGDWNVALAIVGTGTWPACAGPCVGRTRRRRRWIRGLTATGCWGCTRRRLRPSGNRPGGSKIALVYGTAARAGPPPHWQIFQTGRSGPLSANEAGFRRARFGHGDHLLAGLGAVGFIREDRAEKAHGVVVVLAVLGTLGATGSGLPGRCRARSRRQ